MSCATWSGAHRPCNRAINGKAVEPPSPCRWPDRPSCRGCVRRRRSWRHSGPGPTRDPARFFVRTACCSLLPGIGESSTLKKSRPPSRPIHWKVPQTGMKSLLPILVASAMALPIGAASPVGTDGKPLKISPELTATDLARWEPTATAGPVSGPESLPGGARILVVQFKDRVPATFDGLDFDPHRLAVGYLPEDALVIRATDDQAGRLANRSEVAWLGPYQRQWRVSPE